MKAANQTGPVLGMAMLSDKPEQGDINNQRLFTEAGKELLAPAT